MRSRSGPFALGAALCIAGLVLPRRSAAEEPWLDVEGGAHCSATAAELAASIRSQVAGEPNPALRVKVTLSNAGRGATSGASPTLARIEVAIGAQSVGVKRLEAATCAEALEGVVAVVALALSSEALGHDASAPVSATPEVAAHAVDDAGQRSHDVAARADDVSLLLLVAADRGTLVEPTVVVGAGAALRLNAGELRSALWYALPSVREEVSTGLERTSTDYLAVALGYCRGFDAGEWLSGCSGLELGLARHARELEAPDEPRTERERSTPRLAASLGLTLAYRDAPLQPALDLSAQFPLLGGLSEAASFGLRAGLSAGIHF